MSDHNPWQKPPVPDTRDLLNWLDIIAFAGRSQGLTIEAGVHTLDVDPERYAVFMSLIKSAVLRAASQIEPKLMNHELSRRISAEDSDE